MQIYLTIILLLMLNTYFVSPYVSFTPPYGEKILSVSPIIANETLIGSIVYTITKDYNEAIDVHINNLWEIKPPPEVSMVTSPQIIVSNEIFEKEIESLNQDNQRLKLDVQQFKNFLEEKGLTKEYQLYKSVNKINREI